MSEVLRSSGTHANAVHAHLQEAPYSQPFTSLLVDASVLPSTMASARILPSVTYGIADHRVETEVYEILSGPYSLMNPNEGEYFNPHRLLRDQAQVLSDNLANSCLPRFRGRKVKLPSYILSDRNGVHLFLGGTEEDRSTLSEEGLVDIAIAYDLGSVVLGNNVVLGDISVNIGGKTLVEIIRLAGKELSKPKHPDRTDIVNTIKAANKKANRIH